METYNVTFLPEEKTIQIDKNATIMEAAEKASVHINSICGGNGVCGKCRVQVKNGKTRADKNSIAYLSPDEIKDGFLLACQAKVEDNMEIIIPPESRLESEQILMEDVTVDYDEPEKNYVARVPVDPLTFFDPLLQKIHLELDEPSKDDNIGDSERVIRELKKITGFQSFEISLTCLRELASMLRENDWDITATIAKNGDNWKIIHIESGDTTDHNYGLAVDIGTTTVVAQLIHIKSGKVLGVTGSHNLQARYGEDVISRMIFACAHEDKLQRLHNAVIKNINNLIQVLIDENNIGQEQITIIVAAGNTTMAHLLLSLTPCSIRMEPYVPTVNIFPQLSAKDLGIKIHPMGIVEAISAPASYVGGDIVSGVIACGMADRPETSILIDVGTNGEIVIGNNQWLACCSASAGPAFEGGGITNGMRATRGALEKFKIENDKISYETIGNAKVRGLCGSGLIDCIYELVHHGIINPDGKFPDKEHDRIIKEDGIVKFIVAYGNDTETGKDITISQTDISNIIRSKGAVFAAIKSLTDYVGIEFDDIDTFYVAGGFGTYLNIPKAIGIGLLPDLKIEKIKFIGNSSLIGARIALLSSHALERSKKIANGMTNIELSTYQPFMDEYVASMFLPHTNSELFPSVKY